MSQAESASSVAFAVGYTSASQLSREYARAFGLPPARDVERLTDAGDGVTPVMRAPRCPRITAQPTDA